jgi:hypothetical protein
MPGELVLLATISLGCSGGRPADATNTAIVKGKVTLERRPLPAGRAVFAAGNGWTGHGRIRPDGSYQVFGVSLGEVKVGIEDISPPPNAGRGLARRVVIPLRYKDPQTSGLAFTVAASGEQMHNIELSR